MKAPILLRGDVAPADRIPVVRGGLHGLDPETVRRAASRSFDEYGHLAVSVFAALDGKIEDLCRSIDGLARYGSVHESTCGRLRNAGFPLFDTDEAPHYDVVLADLADTTLARLANCFDAPRPNPGRTGRGAGIR